MKQIIYGFKQIFIRRSLFHQGKRATNRYVQSKPYALERLKSRPHIGIYKQSHERCCLRRIPNFDLVKNIPLDYMHLVFLGAMKKLLYLLVLLVRSKRRLQKWEVLKISRRLCFLRKYVPQEFQRKPRSLKDLKFWKATEFRQFLLYTGALVLKNILPQALYVHFNAISVAIRILCSDTYVGIDENLNYAEKLLAHFVQSLGVLYGQHYMSYNMHGLLHLVDDVRKFGKLDNFSAFNFENFMQYLKKWMRKGEKPLQQLVRRYLEFKSNSRRLFKVEESGTRLCTSSDHHSGPLLINCCSPQYRIIYVHGFKMDVTKPADNCFGLTNGEIVIIRNVVTSYETRELVIIGQEFETRRNLYEEPCPSSVVDIYVVKGLTALRMWSLKDVVKKYMRVPSSNNEYIVSSLLHTVS